MRNLALFLVVEGLLLSLWALNWTVPRSHGGAGVIPWDIAASGALLLSLGGSFFVWSLPANCMGAAGKGLATVTILCFGVSMWSLLPMVWEGIGVLACVFGMVPGGLAAFLVKLSPDPGWLVRVRRRYRSSPSRRPGTRAEKISAGVDTGNSS